MEVIPSTARGSGSMPLHQHNVEEWSRLDSLTGMLEHARVETGRWTANTSTSSQQYGKVSTQITSLKMWPCGTITSTRPHVPTSRCESSHRIS